MEKQIKYAYIPIGGVGKRLKDEIPALDYSSKCFLEFQNISLLERIALSCLEYCSQFVIVYCNEEQYRDAYKILSDSFQGHAVKYVKNQSLDPYVCMPEDGDCLAVMGDSYVPINSFRKFVEQVFEDRRLTFLRLYPQKANQPIGYYFRKENRIFAWSTDKNSGYEHFEIGQLLYFPREIVKEAVHQCNQTNPLVMLRNFINRMDYVSCLDLECYNINN